jgi:hypothetical protein
LKTKIKKTQLNALEEIFQFLFLNKEEAKKKLLFNQEKKIEKKLRYLAICFGYDNKEK